MSEHKTDETERGAVLQDLNSDGSENEGGEYCIDRQKRAAARGCPGCAIHGRNVNPEWDGGRWVCPYCSHHFFNPPTFVEYRARCLSCATTHRSVNRGAAVRDARVCCIGTESDRPEDQDE